MACSSGGDRRGGGGRRCRSSGEATRGGRCGGTVEEEATLGGQGRGGVGAEWCGVTRRLSREEEKQRLPRTNNAMMTHTVAAACTACGGDVAASDQQLAGSTDSAGVSASDGSDRSWRGRNCDPTSIVEMGRPQFTAKFIFQYPNYLQTLKYKTKAILKSKNIQTWHDGRVQHCEPLFP
jgi:hypothetical protein